MTRRRKYITTVTINHIKMWKEHKEMSKKTKLTKANIIAEEATGLGEKVRGRAGGLATEAQEGEEQTHQSRSSCPGIISCKAHPRGSTDKLTCNPYSGVSLGPPSVIVCCSPARLCLLGARDPLSLLILFRLCCNFKLQTSLGVKFGPRLVINSSLNTRFITSEIFP